jgi:hypothetical protein
LAYENNGGKNLKSIKSTALLIVLIISSAERDTSEVPKQDTFGENIPQQGTQPTNVRHLRRRRKYVEAILVLQRHFGLYVSLQQGFVLFQGSSIDRFHWQRTPPATRPAVPQKVSYSFKQPIVTGICH